MRDDALAEAHRYIKRSQAEQIWSVPMPEPNLTNVKDKSIVPFLSFSREERKKVFLIYAPLVVATVVGFSLSAFVGNVSVVLAGLGIAAFVFGLRHGVDADHIAAIDNTTRKLMQEGTKPLTVGTWFSLGHSTIVFVLIVALVLSTRAVADDIPGLKSMGTLVGSSISGSFLWIIALINVVIALGLYRTYKQVRSGHIDQAQLDQLLLKRGFLNRYFSPLFRLIKRPWQIYIVGLLFGLGFDTATEVALIAISVGVGVSSSVPMWMILILPFMFTCGMVIVDTTNSIAMQLAYGWAFLKPVRKIYYNLTITVISIMVAFALGGIQFLGVLSSEFSMSGPFWNWLENVNFETLGYGVIGIFAASWVASIGIYKYKKIDEQGSSPASAGV